MNSTGKRCSVRGGFFVALLQLSFLTSMLNIHASASMAPFHQSTAEYRRIFDDSRLLESLNGHLMTSVRQNGNTILIETESGCVIRGSFRDIPRPVTQKPLTSGSSPHAQPTGARLFAISELKADSGCENEVISPTNGGPTTATRLQDFKNVLTKFNDAHYALFRAGSIDNIELVGTNTFRISSDFHHQAADISFTPTVYTPPEDHRDTL